MGIGSTDQVLIVTGGIPAWSSTITGRTWSGGTFSGTIAGTPSFSGAHTHTANVIIGFAANLIWDRSGTYSDNFLDGSNNWTVRTGDGAPGTLQNRLLLSSGAATVTLTLSATNLALGANNLTMTGTISATGARVTQSYHTNITSTNAVTVDSWGRSKTDWNAYTQDALAILRQTKVGSYRHLLNRDPSGRVKLGVLAESIHEPLALVKSDYGHGLGHGPALDTMGLAALNTRAIQQIVEILVREGLYG